MNDNLPIDIHTNKLLDWLISRRHCQRGWQDEVLPVRKKINMAIQDMPEHPEITNLLSGSYINYFNCLKIIEILKETEADSKNVFGFYSSQRMKDWKEIIQMYKKNDIYLAEAAQIFVRNVTYEIPAMKKQIGKFDQIVSEWERKQVECLKNSETMKSQFHLSCKQLGIEGNDIKQELIDLLKELPSFYDSVCSKIKKLSSAGDFYEAFVKYSLNTEEIAICPSVLPMLKFIADHGNATTYEWRYGEPPVRIELPKLDLTTYEQEIPNDVIDFNIDLNDDPILETGEIDWGNLDNEDSFVMIESCEGGDSVLEVDLAGTGIVVEKTGIEGGVAKDSEALTLMDNSKTRNLLLDDLMELEAFLENRLLESQSDSNFMAISQFQNAPSIIQMQSSESIGLMLKQVTYVINELSSVKMQHLYLIQSSPKYVERLVNSLKQKMDVAEKMMNSKSSYEDKSLEATLQQQSLMPKLRKMIDKTKELQKQIEEDISRRYKNRSVNLMGGASTL